MKKRQGLILNYINQNSPVSREILEEYISEIDCNLSKITILRDLKFLLQNKYIQKQGSARNTKYASITPNDLLRKYDVANYFKNEADSRKIKYSNFNFDIYKKLNGLFSKTEISALEKVNKTFRQKAPSFELSLREYERLLIELSWKSSKLEGNTYSLLDTEALIKNGIKAAGHSPAEATMILNHKNAIKFAFENKEYFKKITFKNINELHELLTKDLGVNIGFRKKPVRIIGTNYKPLDNFFEIQEAIEKLTELINSTKNILEKALIAVLMISYIQPFEDGNKRTGRILANSILFSNGYCPLSYRSVDEVEYKKAIIIFYENNSLEYFKRLFIEQFKFAVDTYFFRPSDFMQKPGKKAGA